MAGYDIEQIVTNVSNGNFNDAVDIIKHKCKTNPRILAYKTGMVVIELCNRGMEEQAARMLRYF